MKTHHTLLLVIAAVVIALVAFYPDTGHTPVDAPNNTKDTSMAAPEAANTWTAEGPLSDVSGGQAEGQATAKWNGERYLLTASFDTLPDPQGTDFYEGWIVRRGENMSVISTGKAEKETDGMYSNVYAVPDDLRDHDFYVLTLEPDDGDPAPAAHILEGTIQ